VTPVRFQAEWPSPHCPVRVRLSQANSESQIRLLRNPVADIRAGRAGDILAGAGPLRRKDEAAYFSTGGARAVPRARPPAGGPRPARDAPGRASQGPAGTERPADPAGGTPEQPPGRRGTGPRGSPEAPGSRKPRQRATLRARRGQQEVTERQKHNRNIRRPCCANCGGTSNASAGRWRT
jgi:hypothetical protein